MDVSGNVGSVGSYDVSFSKGQLIASLNAALPPGENVALTVNIDADKVLDALAAAVPNVLTKDIIEGIKLVLDVL